MKIHADIAFFLKLSFLFSLCFSFIWLISSKVVHRFILWSLSSCFIMPGSCAWPYCLLCLLTLACMDCSLPCCVPFWMVSLSLEASSGSDLWGRLLQRGLQLPLSGTLEYSWHVSSLAWICPGISWTTHVEQSRIPEPHERDRPVVTSYLGIGRHSPFQAQPPPSSGFKTSFFLGQFLLRLLPFEDFRCM